VERLSQLTADAGNIAFVTAAEGLRDSLAGGSGEQIFSRSA
jgi:hypothetical protein